ncbi:hypothetical protein Tco_1276367, partial [Tanacetum coccineum]
STTPLENLFSRRNLDNVLYHGELKEEVYVSQPEGFVDTDHLVDDHVLASGICNEDSDSLYP